MLPFLAVFALVYTRVHIHSLIVAILFPTLKHLLIRLFALLLLWTSQMSNQMMAMSDFGDTLIIYGFDAKAMLLKI